MLCKRLNPDRDKTDSAYSVLSCRSFRVSLSKSKTFTISHRVVDVIGELTFPSPPSLEIDGVYGKMLDCIK